MITEARLRDGARALTLPLLPGDREALREGYENLSAEARAHRFLAGVPHLTEPMLDHLVDEVDGIDHVALALVVLGEEDEGTPAGVGRIIRYPDRRTAADVAVTVVDGWHGRGVGPPSSPSWCASGRWASRITSPRWPPTTRPRWRCSAGSGRPRSPRQGTNRFDVVVDLPEEKVRLNVPGPRPLVTLLGLL